jgi:arylformamidase
MDLEAEYNNRARVPEHPDIIAGWQRDAAAFRDAAGGELDLAYGDHARQRLDVFRSKDDQAGPMAMFVHGGYWVNFDKDHFSHMARGLEFHGVPMAVPSYRLAPEVRIGDIIEDMRRCCLFLWQRYSRRLVIAGHSAGGHLAAAMLATDWKSLGAPEDLVTAGLGISGVYDLRPLIPIAMNASLGSTSPRRARQPAVVANPDRRLRGLGRRGRKRRVPPPEPHPGRRLARRRRRCALPRGSRRQPFHRHRAPGPARVRHYRGACGLCGAP